MEPLKKECILSDVYQLQKRRVIIVASVLVLIIFVQTSFMIWMGIQCPFDENTSVSAAEVSFVRVCLAHIHGSLLQKSEIFCFHLMLISINWRPSQKVHTLKDAIRHGI